MYCDTFKDEVGCVLMQSGRVVAYGSQQLKNHKQSYPTHDIELVAIVFTLKAWCHCVYDEQFEVFSYHKSLKYMFTQRDLNMANTGGWSIWKTMTSLCITILIRQMRWLVHSVGSHRECWLVLLLGSGRCSRLWDSLGCSTGIRLRLLWGV